MFNNEMMADVHFVVGPPGGTQRVPGHKVPEFICCLTFDLLLVLVFLRHETHRNHDSALRIVV